MNRTVWFAAALAAVTVFLVHRQTNAREIIDVSDSEMSVLMGGDPTCSNTKTHQSSLGCNKERSNSCTGAATPCDGTKQCPASCIRNTYFVYPPGEDRMIFPNTTCPDDINFSLCTDGGAGTCFCDAGNPFSFGCQSVNYTPLCGS